MTITNNTTPKAHTSAGYPRYYIFDTIYGAIKLGVPQNIFTFLLFYKQVANPKSINLGSNLVSIKILSSFISLWQTDCSCRYFIASTSFVKIILASFSANLPPTWFFNNDPKDIPDTYYMMMLTWLLVYKASYTFKILLWSILCKILIYLLTDRRLWGSFIFLF